MPQFLASEFARQVRGISVRRSRRVRSRRHTGPQFLGGNSTAGMLPFPSAGGFIADNMNTDDWQLLDDYAVRHSEDAFRALVDRHAGMVYHTALRHVGDPHQAEEITQAVFIALAHKAGRISRSTVLSGWLFRATRFAVARQVRGESHRQRHEQEAILMETLSHEDETDTVWEQIAPQLNDALDKLPPKDRDAVLIRFFQDKSHKELARMLGVSEDAAKMRVSRAVEKLRLIFARQGLVVPGAVLATTLAAHSAQVAPAGLTASVTAVALAKGAAGTASTLAGAKGILHLMNWAKLKTALVISAGLLAAAGAATLAVNSSGASMENVVRQLERKSGKKIVWDKRLKLPAAYLAKDTSLELALDELAVEAGGYWSVDYAVYSSDQGLRGLLTALQDGAELQSVQWTNLSSRLLKPSAHILDYRSGGSFIMGTNPPANLVGMVVVLDRETSAKQNRDFQQWFLQNRQAFQRGESPDGRPNDLMISVIKQAMTDGMTEGVLAPERLLAESRLAAKIGGASPWPATPRAAAQAAKAAQAQWTTIYTLRNSPLDGAGIELIHAGRRTIYSQTDTEMSQAGSGGQVMEQLQLQRFNLSPDELAAHQRAVEAAKQKSASGAK